MYMLYMLSIFVG